MSTLLHFIVSKPQMSFVIILVALGVLAIVIASIAEERETSSKYACDNDKKEH